MSERTRIFLTGVGGQGTLTATNLLALAVLDKGLPVTSGEIHGMAQRGGVVESTILIGGWQSLSMSHGEADVLLGFEPLETLRALPYLKPGGTIVSSSEAVPPVAVSLGQAEYPPFEHIKEKAEACSGAATFVPCRTLGLEAGALQSGNIALLGAACSLGLVAVDVDELKAAVAKHLRPKLVDTNVRAIDIGVAALS